MAISPQRLTIYLYSAHRAVIFAMHSFLVLLKPYRMWSRILILHAVPLELLCSRSPAVAEFEMGIRAANELTTPRKQRQIIAHSKKTNAILSASYQPHAARRLLSDRQPARQIRLRLTDYRSRRSI